MAGCHQVAHPELAHVAERPGGCGCLGAMDRPYRLYLLLSNSHGDFKEVGGE
jgi:hypothetical protein